VLITNHVRLLLSGNVAGAVSGAMHRVGLRYVAHINRSSGRTGTMFEGRYRSSLVQTERYLLTCMRYIEDTRFQTAIAAMVGRRAHVTPVGRPPRHPAKWT
jgi:putative transposase